MNIFLNLLNLVLAGVASAASKSIRTEFLLPSTVNELVPFALVAYGPLLDARMLINLSAAGRFFHGHVCAFSSQ